MKGRSDEMKGRSAYTARRPVVMTAACFDLSRGSIRARTRAPARGTGNCLLMMALSQHGAG